MDFNKGDLVADIMAPSALDVVCGRGGKALKHPGNLNYRRLVALNKAEYTGTIKREKLRISRSIVSSIRKQGGKFLERHYDKWYDIGDKKAIEKTSQALREGQPKLRQKLESKSPKPQDAFVKAVLTTQQTATGTPAVHGQLKNIPHSHENQYAPITSMMQPMASMPPEVQLAMYHHQLQVQAHYNQALVHPVATLAPSQLPNFQSIHGIGSHSVNSNHRPIPEIIDSRSTSGVEAQSGRPVDGTNDATTKTVATALGDGGEKEKSHLHSDSGVEDKDLMLDEAKILLSFRKLDPEVLTSSNEDIDRSSTPLENERKDFQGDTATGKRLKPIDRRGMFAKMKNKGSCSTTLVKESASSSSSSSSSFLDAKGVKVTSVERE